MALSWRPHFPFFLAVFYFFHYFLPDLVNFVPSLPAAKALWGAAAPPAPEAPPPLGRELLGSRWAAPAGSFPSLPAYFVLQRLVLRAGHRHGVAIVPLQLGQHRGGGAAAGALHGREQRRWRAPWQRRGPGDRPEGRWPSREPPPAPPRPGPAQPALSRRLAASLWRVFCPTDGPTGSHSRWRGGRGSSAPCGGCGAPPELGRGQHGTRSATSARAFSQHFCASELRYHRHRQSARPQNLPSL